VGPADVAAGDDRLQVGEPGLVLDGRDGVDDHAVLGDPVGIDELSEERPRELGVLVVLGQSRSEHIPNPVGVLDGRLLPVDNPFLARQGVLVGRETG